MKTRINKLLSVLLSCVMLLALFPALSAFAEETPEITDSGTITDQSTGDVLNWTFDSTGTLTVNGTGTVPKNAAWESHKTEVKKLVLGEGITELASKAFYGYAAMEEAVLPESLQKLNDGAFSTCSALQTLSLGANLTLFSNNAVNYCSSLTQINVSEDNAVFSSEDGVLFNKTKTELIRYPEAKTDEEYVVPDGVTSIASCAFLELCVTKRVVIPDGVTSMGYMTFTSGRSLKSISIGEGIMSVPSSMCSTCWNLESVSLPQSVTTIGSSAFYFCQKLQNVTIPENVTRIESDAFYECESLAAVALPASVTSLQGNPFCRCKSLSSIIVAPGNPVFHAEGNCVIHTQQKRIVSNAWPFRIPTDGSVTSIGPFCFSYVPISDLELPKVITSLDGWAFMAADVKNVWYDGTVEEYNAISGIDRSRLTMENVEVHFTAYDEPPIIDSGFCGTDEDPAAVSWTLNSEGTWIISGTGAIKWSLTASRLCLARARKLIINEGVTSIPDYFISDYRIRELYLPASLESIGKNAFHHVKTLQTVIIAPNSHLKTIGDLAFYLDYPLTGLVLPCTVESIGELAFCSTALTEAVILRPDCVLSGTVFGTGVTIRGYAGSTAEAYAAEKGNPFELIGPGDLAGHGTAVTVTENETAATCTGDGGYDEAAYCTVCGDEISRTHFTVNANGHTPGEAVTENNIPATCTENGRYDEVVYCTVCPAEISRTHVDIPATDHSWGEWEVIRQATTEEEGLMRRTCLSDPSHVEEEVIPKLQPQTNTFRQFIQRIRDFFSNIVDWFSRLFRF